jgi:DNA-binding NarL/FixJ family response regulator
MPAAQLNLDRDMTWLCQNMSFGRKAQAEIRNSVFLLPCTLVPYSKVRVIPDDRADQPRERELVTLVARGTPDAQIAGQLYISVRTRRCG